jgi:DNA-binding GntR family transcriptional regulator
VLSNTYRSINARVQSLRFRTNQNETKWKHAVEEHEQMIDALAKRDAAAMRKVLVAHVLRKRDTVLELLRAGEIYPSAKSS